MFTRTIHSLAGALRIVACVACVAVFAASCGDDAVPINGQCEIDFERLGGEASSRLDILLAADINTYKRIVQEDGAGQSAAIYYRYADDDANSYRAEELDADNDDALDASMVRSERLFDLIDLYQVDAIADDDMVDSLQVSVGVPSSAFGKWNPARAYYTLACGPSHSVYASEDAGLITLEIDLNDDGTIDIWMRMFFIDGQLQRWVVDNKLDDIIDFRATPTYDDLGRITSLEWQDWEFSSVSRSEWSYDDNGLVTFIEDSNGNAIPDHIVHFSAGCWDPEAAPEQAEDVTFSGGAQ